MQAFFSGAREVSHSALAVGSAVIGVAAGGATVIADIINNFGGHVTYTDVTAKTTLASAGIVLFSKAIDSANDAWVSSRLTSSASPTTLSTSSVPPTP